MQLQCTVIVSHTMTQALVRVVKQGMCLCFVLQCTFRKLGEDSLQLIPHCCCPGLRNTPPSSLASAIVQAQRQRAVQARAGVRRPTITQRETTLYRVDVFFFVLETPYTVRNPTPPPPTKAKFLRDGASGCQLYVTESENRIYRYCQSIIPC